MRFLLDNNGNFRLLFTCRHSAVIAISERAERAERAEQAERAESQRLNDGKSIIVENCRYYLIKTSYVLPW